MMCSPTWSAYMSDANLYHQNACYVCAKFVLQKCLMQKCMAQICNVKMGITEFTKL